MNRKSLITLAIVALLATLAVPFVYAQSHGMHGMAGQHGEAAFGPLGHLQKLQSALGLSDAQVTEIKTIFTDLRAQNATYRDQLKANRQAMTAILLKDPTNVAAAQAILDQQVPAENAMKSNFLNAASKALSVLTPDQRAKLGDLIAQRQARWAGRQGK